MAKNTGKAPASKSTNGKSRPPSTHPDQGGNWPSTTGRVSGKGRGNAKPGSGQ